MSSIEIQKPASFETVSLLKTFIANGIRGQQEGYKPYYFLCPSGEGKALMQRIRVKLSRERKKKKKKDPSGKMKHFRLTSEITLSNDGETELIRVELVQRIGDILKEAAEDHEATKADFT